MKKQFMNKVGGFAVLKIVIALLAFAFVLVTLATGVQTIQRRTEKSLSTNTFIRETADERVVLTEQEKRDGSWSLEAKLIGPDTSITIIGTDRDWSAARTVDGTPVPTFETWSMTAGRSDETYQIEKTVEYGPHGIPSTKVLYVDHLPKMTDDDIVEVEPQFDAFDLLDEYEIRLMKAVALTYKQEYLQIK